MLNEDNRKFVHPTKEHWINTGDEELDEIFPTLPEAEQSYLKTVSSQAYNTMVDRLEKYTGFSADELDLPRILSIFMQSYKKAMQIESIHTKELESLAIKFVLGLEEFKMVNDAQESGDLKFDVKLGLVETNFNIDDEPGEEPGEELSQAEELNLDLAKEFGGISENSLKRRLANLLIQGGATLKLYAFNLIGTEIDKINKNLMNFYGMIATFAQLGYWMSPSGVEELAASGVESRAGSEEVVPTGDAYIIKVRATCFPFLVHELVKGIYEWISIDPDLQAEMKVNLKHETEDIIVGPEIFKTLQQYLKFHKQYLLPLVQKKFLQLSRKEVKDVLLKGDAGSRIMDGLIRDAEANWKEYEKSKSNESINEGISDARKAYLDTGKVPKNVFDEFVRGDPSKTKKYLMWMGKQYVSNPDRQSHIVDVVQLFDKQIKGGVIKGEDSDINRYSLEQADEKLSASKEQKTKGEEKREKKSESNVISETDRYLIVRPLTHDASCFYGAGTKWCISARTSEYWKSYWSKGSVIYIIIDKKTNRKYAVEVDPWRNKNYFDEEDKKISYDSLKRELGIK